MISGDSAKILLLLYFSLLDLVYVGKEFLTFFIFFAHLRELWQRIFGSLYFSLPVFRAYSKDFKSFVFFFACF
jgi:hypothetical protein